MRKKTNRNPNLKGLSGFDFVIPEGHKRVLVSITQADKSIDKDEAREILKTRPYMAGLTNNMIYRGATSKYHVFSYLLDPTRG